MYFDIKWSIVDYRKIGMENFITEKVPFSFSRIIFLLTQSPTHHFSWLPLIKINNAYEN